MEWGWGEAAARAFTGVAPVEVDIESEGFYAATPLLDLPPQAGAAYLGTFLLSLLNGLEFYEKLGLFIEPLVLAHTLTSLTSPRFWREAIRPYLSPECQQVLGQVVTYLISQGESLGLSPEQSGTMERLASGHDL